MQPSACSGTPKDAKGKATMMPCEIEVVISWLKSSSIPWEHPKQWLIKRGRQCQLRQTRM